jgi:hypothetical protein
VKDLDEFYMQEQRDCQHPVPLTMMGYLSAKGIAAGALSAIWAGNAPSGLAVKASWLIIIAVLLPSISRNTNYTLHESTLTQ